ncbi:MAG: prepilin-type N-terminal cleavage/methylation domain-containing protein [Gammaproteobacteria bacterium]|nr:prepilin-type N-terminal cleavage/methylation domain-containing protein [Gammaproteobacteria bacterium]
MNDHKVFFRGNRGFSLIELMITVSILIILVAIAVPNYRSHVLRSQRSDAMSALLRVAAEQEKFYMQNNTYTGTLGTGGLNIKPTSQNGHYKLSVSGADQQGFVAEAVPNTAPDEDIEDSLCVFFSFDQQGQKYAHDSGDADTTTSCWR